MHEKPLATLLSPDTFHTHLCALNPPSRFAVAVSGGRDSMALLLLCADYGRKQGATITALTVDHGLRDAAADEARQVRSWCNALGVDHKILVWAGDKPSAGIQAAARHARYRLLIEAGQTLGCEALLTAHTADDQAETLFMRLSRGGGVHGLAAMPQERLIAAGAGPVMRLLRPMLFCSRAAVTTYLKDAGQAFIDDPSNLDPAYERIRVRALLAALGEQDLLNADALAATAQKLGTAAARLRAQEDALLETLGGCMHPWGGVSFARWSDGPGAAGLARRLIYAVSGAEHYCDEDKAGEALAALCAGGSATLSGALVTNWNGRVWFLREPSALTGRAGVAPAGHLPLAAPLLWDRRFIVTPSPASGLCVGPMGQAGIEVLGAQRALFQGPDQALCALPGLFSHGALIGAPALPFMGEDRAVARALTRERYQAGIIRFS